MTEKTKLTIIINVLLVTGFGLCFYWFGWKMLLVILLLIWGNNLYMATNTDEKIRKAQNERRLEEAVSQIILGKNQA